MSPKLRIYLIDTAIKIIRAKSEVITSENISCEFNKMVELMKIPLIEIETENIKFKYDE